jgi:DNA-binding SARP family transcriptional activator
MLNQIRATAVQQLQTLPAHIRLVVIHPNFPRPRAILSQYLDANAIYVRFDGEKLTHKQLLSQLEAATEFQTNSVQIGDDATIILDECDRAEEKALGAFLAQLLETTSHTKIIVFSREIPHKIISDSALRQQSTFIPHNHEFMLLDYAQLDSANSQLEVRAFGEGHVLLNGKRVANWEGILPRSLFFYFVDRGMATRTDIFETFWDTLTTQEATNVFHVTKRKISEMLKTDLTKYWSGYYRIAPDIELNYDAIKFTDLIQNSEIAGEDDEAINLLSHAIYLYQGHFLGASDMAWINNRREELKQSFGEALAQLANLTEKLGQTRKALGLYLRAAVSARFREDFIINIMRLYHELGMSQDSLVVYERFLEELKRQPEIIPSSQLHDLAETIRQQALS